MDIAAKISEFGACHGAIQFCRKFDDPQAAWEACSRGDWMLHLLREFRVPWKDLKACIEDAYRSSGFNDESVQNALDGASYSSGSKYFFVVLNLHPNAPNVIRKHFPCPPLHRVQ